MEQARQVALAHLAASGMGDVNPTIVDSQTQEFAAGWVFQYQSARYLETRDIREILAGNAPVFVPRSEAPAAFVGYHRPLTESIAAFLSCGNINAYHIAQVALTGWRPGALVVPAIQSIRQHSSLGLAAAKHAIDECLAEREARVATTSVSAAKELVAALSQVRFAAEVTYGD